MFILSDKMKRDCQTKGLKRNLSGLHSGREPPVSQRPITDSKDIARVTGKDFIRRPKRFLHKRKMSGNALETLVNVMYNYCAAGAVLRTRSREGVPEELN